MTNLKLKDYKLLMSCGDSITTPKSELEFSSGFVKVSQTAGSNQLLHQFILEALPSNSEAMVADLLLSYLIEANRNSFFEWKKSNPKPNKDQEEKDITKAWPVTEFDIIPYLKNTAQCLYPVGVSTSVYHLRGKWIQHILKVLNESTGISRVLEVTCTSPSVKEYKYRDKEAGQECIISFPRSVVDKVATLSNLPSALEAPAILYRFDTSKAEKVPYSFYVNRTLVLAFSMAEFESSKGEESSSSNKDNTLKSYKMKSFLTIMVLPDFYTWAFQLGSKTSPKKTVNNWYIMTVERPVQRYGLFEVETSMKSCRTLIKRKYKTSKELEAEIDAEDSTDILSALEGDVN